MRLIMAGGGTGGHLFPGLAVAREFQRRDPKVDILFVGTDMGIESRILPSEGFALKRSGGSGPGSVWTNRLRSDRAGCGGARPRHG